MYTILGRPNCKWCDKAKDLLDSKQIAYKYVDLPTEIWVAAIMMKAGYHQVPLVIYQTEVVGGYVDLEARFKEGSV